MPYRYLDNIATADVAFEARGGTPEELCVAAADALMNVMVENLDSIEARRDVDIGLEAENVEMLLFRLLDELVYHKDAGRLLLRVRDVRIVRAGDSLRLRARAYGEEIDPAKHRLLVDVKAVTMHRYAVEETDGGWKATVVVDV